MVVGQDNLDLDDGARIVFLENGPLAVRGAVYDGVVVSALLDKRLQDCTSRQEEHTGKRDVV